MTRLRVRAMLMWILILLVPVAMHQLWDYIEVRRLVVEIERVIAKGQPVTETQAVAGTSPHQRDAGAYYMAAGMVTRRAIPDPAVPVQEWLAGAVPRPGEDLMSALHGHIADATDALVLADKAAALGFIKLPPGTEYSYRTSHVLNVAHVVSGRTLSLSLAGQGDEAVASAISSLALRRPIRDIGAAFLNYGVSHHTAAILSLSDPSTAALVNLQRALESESQRDDVLEGLLLARARGIERVWQRYYGPDPSLASDYRPRSHGFMDTVQRPFATHGIVRAMRKWAELIDAVSKPWPDRLRAVEALDARHGRSRPRGPEDQLLFPSTSAGGAASQILPRAVLIDRASATAIAIERFRRDHDGSLPGTLAELAPRYFATVPVDPYSGQPLLFAKDDLAYVIYGVGRDGKDDGGDLVSEHLAAQKRGHGQRRLRGRDEGIRVLMGPTASPAPAESR